MHPFVLPLLTAALHTHGPLALHTHGPLAAPRRAAPAMFFQSFKNAFANEDLDGPQREEPPATVTSARIAAAAWTIELALKGISSSDDPSSNLYGPRVSVRDGALIAPLCATIALGLRKDGTCSVEASPLTTGADGMWWLVKDELQVCRLEEASAHAPYN